MDILELILGLDDGEDEILVDGLAEIEVEGEELIDVLGLGCTSNKRPSPFSWRILSPSSFNK